MLSHCVDQPIPSQLRIDCAPLGKSTSGFGSAGAIAFVSAASAIRVKVEPPELMKTIVTLLGWGQISRNQFQPQTLTFFCPNADRPSARGREAVFTVPKIVDPVSGAWQKLIDPGWGRRRSRPDFWLAMFGEPLPG